MCAALWLEIYTALSSWYSYKNALQNDRECHWTGSRDSTPRLLWSSISMSRWLLYGILWFVSPNFTQNTQQNYDAPVAWLREDWGARIEERRLRNEDWGVRTEGWRQKWRLRTEEWRMKSDSKGGLRSEDWEVRIRSEWGLRSEHWEVTPSEDWGVRSE